ncbi:MAG: ROK family transcriptional regulator [Chloroflexi bacterium]|nr:ROK family transcriptional regulator [Chloroflexota bacterium]
MNAHSHPQTALHHHSLALPRQQYRVVRLMRALGVLSRGELAQQLGYSRATVTGLVKDLLDRGIIHEVPSDHSTGGRRAKNLVFKADFASVLGVDMGATSVDIALANFRGDILLRHQEPIDVRDGPEPVLDRVVEIAQDLIRRAPGTGETLRSVGIGVPGPVDFLNGVLNVPPIMPGWERYPIRHKIQETFPHTTVVVDNDVNIMALGELRAGAGKGVDNFIFVKVGTGIGAGIVVGGEIYRGSTGSAGDIGHIQADRNGPVCHCGNIGCVEAMASGSALARQAVEAAQSGRSPILAQYLAAGAQLTAEHVGAAASAGDKAAMELIKTSGTLIGGVLAGVVNFFNPSLILIGGGVANIGTQFLATIRRGVLSRSLPLSTQHLRIDYSPMSEDAGVTGAVALALEHIFVGNL